MNGTSGCPALDVHGWDSQRLLVHITIRASHKTMWSYINSPTPLPSPGLQCLHTQQQLLPYCERKESCPTARGKRVWLCCWNCLSSKAQGMAKASFHSCQEDWKMERKEETNTCYTWLACIFCRLEQQVAFCRTLFFLFFFFFGGVGGGCFLILICLFKGLTAFASSHQPWQNLRTMVCIWRRCTDLLNLYHLPCLNYNRGRVWACFQLQKRTHSCRLELFPFGIVSLSIAAHILQPWRNP